MFVCFGKLTDAVVSLHALRGYALREIHVFKYQGYSQGFEISPVQQQLEPQSGCENTHCTLTSRCTEKQLQIHLQEINSHIIWHQVWKPEEGERGNFMAKEAELI